MGRWEEARDLLTATGEDWERRIFRLQVLARAGVRLRFAETWAEAQPESADALSLLAYVLALRSMVADAGPARQMAEDAWNTAKEAADAYPADPSPWVLHLAILRIHVPNWSILEETWAQVTARDPYNREAHHEVLAYLFERNHGRAGEMFQWAQERAETSPIGLPLAVLPLVALAESHRQRLESDTTTYGLLIHPWLDCPLIDRVLDRWWRHRPAEPHAGFMDDANYLAHALSYAGRHQEAWEVFEAIGPYACDLPWAYCGKDPRSLFLRHRRWALRDVDHQAAR
ncbi:hypothetical protein [Streptomyces lydicus]|uniref:hypothetical protein n=1 Tax=Streptomyces lydicus TaxID=47763 RepID=UPI0036EC19E0